MNLLKNKILLVSITCFLILISVAVFTQRNTDDNNNSSASKSSSIFQSSNDNSTDVREIFNTSQSSDNSENSSSESSSISSSLQEASINSIDNIQSVFEPTLETNYSEDINLSQTSSGLYNNYIFSREKGIALTISISEPFGTDAGGYCSDNYTFLTDDVVKIETSTSSSTIIRYSPLTQTFLKDSEEFDNYVKVIPNNGDLDNQQACVGLIPRFTKNINQTEQWMIGSIEIDCSNCTETIEEYEAILLEALNGTLQ